MKIFHLLKKILVFLIFFANIHKTAKSLQLLTKHTFPLKRTVRRIDAILLRDTRLNLAHELLIITRAHRPAPVLPVDGELCPLVGVEGRADAVDLQLVRHPNRAEGEGACEGHPAPRGDGRAVLDLGVPVARLRLGVFDVVVDEGCRWGGLLAIHSKNGEYIQKRMGK